MDITQITQMYQGLTFLAWTTGIILIIISVFLGKLLFDLSKLTRNLNETTTIVKTEIQPTLKNVNETTEILNRIMKDTDEQLNKVKQVSDKLSDISIKVFEKAAGISKILTKGFFSGLWFVIKSFSKSK